MLEQEDLQRAPFKDPNTVIAVDSWHLTTSEQFWKKKKSNKNGLVNTSLLCTAPTKRSIVVWLVSTAIAYEATTTYRSITNSEPPDRKY